MSWNEWIESKCVSTFKWIELKLVSELPELISHGLPIRYNQISEFFYLESRSESARRLQKIAYYDLPNYSSCGQKEFKTSKLIYL